MYEHIMARKGGRWDEAMFAGLQITIKNTLLVPFTQEDIDEAVEFYNMHFLPMYANQVFDKEMFQYILDTYNGYFPVKIKAVQEGTVVPVGNVMATVESTDEKCAACVSFLETLILRDIWYATTVATNSYMQKKDLIRFGNQTSDNLDWLVFALHDFGARGVSSGESAVTGGTAHLFNFMGSDNLEAVYGAQKLYGIAEGLPGYSVTASEHSVMSSEGRDGEFRVMERIFDVYAKEGGIIACVNDTYDMWAHVNYLCTKMKDRILASGVRWVTRPDSGEPTEVVIQCLNQLWDAFGGEINSKGCKVLNPAVRVIQGDGIDQDMLRKVLYAIQTAGFSTENVAFGSGGGLLQKVDRDTLRFAMKASYIEVDGVGREIYKEPATQTGNYDKSSPKGKVELFKNVDGNFFTATAEQVRNQEVYPQLALVYEDGKLYRDMTLDEVRANTCLW
jgi:nicotinamide phosphoribosyltransferase